jgi:uroporphyrinogen-III synthase
MNYTSHPSSALIRDVAPRILITRAPHQASALADSVRAHGLEPVLIPTIELAPPTSFCALDAALSCLRSFHWLLFTSANAVEAFANRLKLLHPSTPPSSLLSTHCRIAAIGPATARAIAEVLGTKPTLTPPQAVAESLAQSLLPHALQPDAVTGQAIPTRFLLVRAEQARDHLPDTLRAAGADVTIAPAYRTLIPAHSIDLIRKLFSSTTPTIDAITFTSSSTATNLLGLLEAANLTLPPDIPRISIGPITSQTLRDLNLPPHAEATEPNIPSLVEILVTALNLKKPL